MSKIKNIFQDIYNNICFLISLLILLAFTIWAGIAIGSWTVIGEFGLQPTNPDPNGTVGLGFIIIGLALAQFILFFIYWDKNRKTKQETTQNDTR